MKRAPSVRFSGIGAPKGTWTKRRYDAQGNVIEPGASAPAKRGPSYHVRFKPFASPQIDRKTSRELGLKRDKQGLTHFTSESQLDRYLAHEKHHGRDVRWKDHQGDD